MAAQNPESEREVAEDRWDPLGRAAEAMSTAGVDALLVGPGADLRYLCGYDAHASERLTMLVARSDGRHRLVVPELERPRAQAAGLPATVELVAWGEHDDPLGLVSEALAGVGPRPRLGVGDHLWARFLLRLQARLPAARWAPASEVTASLRIRKAAHEQDALRRAAAAIDRVHAGVPGLLRPGRSEAQVARDLAEGILATGHEQVSFVIVASGPNGASPHHTPGDRRLAEGDAIVVDIGGTVDGYGSDCTRSYCIGTPPQGYLELHTLLEQAHDAALAAVRPGVTAGAVDHAARSLLSASGHGALFVHRTGHGIGLEAHEEPYLVSGSTTVLEPGMAFSIEPGLYVPGRFGLRIEDIVLVTDHGVERLNRGDRRPVMVDPEPVGVADPP